MGVVQSFEPDETLANIVQHVFEAICLTFQLLQRFTMVCQLLLG